MVLLCSMRKLTVWDWDWFPSINSIFTRDCKVVKSAFSLLWAFNICFAFSLGLSPVFEERVWVLLHPKSTHTIKLIKIFFIASIELPQLYC